MEQHKQNVQVATKTTENTAVKTMHTGNELTQVKLAETKGPKDAELGKMLRRPRKRKVMKILKGIDILSAEDEQMIQRIKQEAENKGNVLDVEAIKEMDKEEAAEEVVEQYMNFYSLKTIISPCGLPDCWIHTIDKNGSILAHYKSTDEMDDEMRRAGGIVSACDQWTCVEIYDDFMMHLTEKGDLIRIYE